MFFGALILFSFALANANYEPHLSEWKASLSNLNNSELNTIANLIYWSYHHSLSNLDAQSSGEKCFDSMWKCWQNVANKRLNAGNEKFAKIDPKTFSSSAHRFSHIVAEHDKISAKYTKMTDEVFKNESTSADVKKVCENMRERVKHEITLALCGEFVNEFINFLHKIKCKKKLASFLIFKLFKRNRSPFYNWATQQFSNFYGDYNEASVTCWDTFFKTQLAGNFVWQAIENVRKNYYNAHYNVVIEVLKSRKAEKKYLQIFFSDAKNFLPEKLRD